MAGDAERVASIMSGHSIWNAAWQVKSPMQWAVMGGSKQTVEALLAEVDPDAIDKMTGEPPVFCAAREGSLEMTRLLGAKSDLALRSNSGMGVMAAAMRGGDIEVAEWLLPRCDPWAQDEHGGGALGEACAAGWLRGARWLTSLQGWDPSSKASKLALGAALAQGHRGCALHLAALVELKSEAEARSMADLARRRGYGDVASWIEGGRLAMDEKAQLAAMGMPGAAGRKKAL